MNQFNPHAYGQQFSLLLETNRCRPLGMGEPADEMRGPLRNLTVAEAFRSIKVADEAMARCCIAGMWLLYDFLDESHQLSQQIKTPEGSFWHAIMHRREGDFSNSKYWFRNVGEHPVFEPLQRQAIEIAERDPQTDAVDKLVVGEAWDPYRFVDLCERVERGQPDIRQECELIQQAEWELLFDFCYRAAAG